MEAKLINVRSKSSSTDVGLTDRRRTSETADFQKALVKKRGVYVEKKVTKYRGDNDLSPKRDNGVKPPPRPKPGNKKFLSSVLSILSKDTTGTQYPESNTDEQKKVMKKQVRKKVEQIDKKKGKFRSKALNNAVGEDKDEIIVLQAQNEIPNTPSNYSEDVSLNRSNVSSVKRSVDKNLEACNDELSEAANSLVKQVMEGKLKNEKRVRIDEPVTLVGEMNEKPGIEKNKDMYNFFVDLLETTISSYNVNVEYDKPTEQEKEPSNAPSTTKVPLEIDEVVAKKLNIPCGCPEKRITEDSCCSGENRFYCLNDDLDFIGGMTSTPSIGNAYVQKTKKLKARSFSFVPKPKPKPKRITESFLTNNKTFSGKKLKKQALINLFKEQLKMDDDAFVEPQNLYEALKVIADSKRRCRRSIQFDEARELSQDYNFPEYKGCKNGRKAMKAKTQWAKDLSVTSYQKKNSYVKNARNDYESNYSLQVLGFEYEKPVVKNKVEKRWKEVLFAFHSSPSGSVEEFDPDDSVNSLYG